MKQRLTSEEKRAKKLARWGKGSYQKNDGTRRLDGRLTRKGWREAWSDTMKKRREAA